MYQKDFVKIHFRRYMFHAIFSRPLHIYDSVFMITNALIDHMYD